MEVQTSNIRSAFALQNSCYRFARNLAAQWRPRSVRWSESSSSESFKLSEDSRFASSVNMKEHDSEFESNNGNSVTKSEQSQVNVAASGEGNIDDAVVDVEHFNVEDEQESAILTEIEREEYQ